MPLSRPRESVMAHLGGHGRQGVGADRPLEIPFRPPVPQPIPPQAVSCPRPAGAAGVVGVVGVVGRAEWSLHERLRNTHREAEWSLHERLRNTHREAELQPPRWANLEVRKDDGGDDAHVLELMSRRNRIWAKQAQMQPEGQARRAGRRDPRIRGEHRAVLDRPMK
jgi:hypothetical protein